MTRLARILAIFLAAFSLGTSATHAATAIWIGPPNGNWSDPANWSTGVVPFNLDVAIIDDKPTQATTVTASTSTFVNSLRVDAADELVVAVNGFTAGTTELAGTLRINAIGRFDAGGQLLIEPTGLVVLTPGGPAQLSAAGPLAQLWWNQGIIRGVGILRPRGTFWNEGILTANEPFGLLDVQPFAPDSSTLLTNTGVAQASGGGHLRFRYNGVQPTTIHQPGNLGRIEAGPLSKVTLDRIILDGGTLAALSDATGTGTVDTTDTVFDNVTLEGTINATRGTLAGNIINTGKLQVLQNVTIAPETVELSGGGLVQLTTPMTASLGAPVISFATSGSPSKPVLRNLDNTIRGAGRLLLAGNLLDNRGVIEAGFGSDDAPTHPARSLYFEQAPILNSGTLRASANNLIGLSNTSITNHSDNTQGVIEALPGGTVELWTTAIAGGILRAVPAEQGSLLPDGVVRFNSSSSRLSNLKLEGNIGTSMNQATVDGRIEIDGTLRLTELLLTAKTEFVGGVVALGENGGQLRLATEVSGSTPAILTLTGTILRVGSVNSTAAYNLQIDNRGTIAVLPNATATFFSNQILLNSGLLHAQAGSHLNLSIIETPQGATDAELRVDAGAMISTPRLVGGKVVSAPGSEGEPFSGSVTISGFSTLPALQDVGNRGLVKLQAGPIAGVIENQGIVEFSGGSIYQAGSLLQFTGAGELRLLGRSLQRNTSPTGMTLLNGPQHTIRTHGLINYQSATFVNQGIVQADTGTMNIDTTGFGGFLQLGTLRTVGANSLNVSLSQQTFNNDGNFDIAPTGTIAITGTQQINNRTSSDILVDGTLSTATANLVNYSGATLRGGGLIRGTGTTATNQSIVTNQGLVAPGSTIGDLHVRGNYVQSATGVLEIDVAGFDAGEFDQLVIESIDATSGGVATLAGTLDFNFAPEVIPSLDDQLVLLVAQQVTGTFDHVLGLPTLAVGLGWQIDYLPTMVTASVIEQPIPILPGDFNHDGYVNLADYTVWRDGLDSEYTLGLYDVWKQNFGRSIHDPVPESIAPQNVPEPSTTLIALFGLALLLTASRTLPLVPSPQSPAGRTTLFPPGRAGSGVE